MNTTCEFSEQVHAVQPGTTVVNIWLYR